jgi:hypothetical protein
MKYLILLLFLSFTAHADSGCSEYVDAYEGGCISLLHYMIYGSDGVRNKKLINRKTELELLDYCEKTEKQMLSECQEEEKRNKK